MVFPLEVVGVGKQEITCRSHIYIYIFYLGESITTVVFGLCDMGSNPADCLITPRDNHTDRKPDLQIRRGLNS
jgi:hypothetical protein